MTKTKKPTTEEKLLSIYIKDLKTINFGNDENYKKLVNQIIENSMNPDKATTIKNNQRIDNKIRGLRVRLSKIVEANDLLKEKGLYFCLDSSGVEKQRTKIHYIHFTKEKKASDYTILNDLWILLKNNKRKIRNTGNDKILNMNSHIDEISIFYNLDETRTNSRIRELIFLAISEDIKIEVVLNINVVLNPKKNDPEISFYQELMDKFNNSEVFREKVNKNLNLVYTLTENKLEQMNIILKLKSHQRLQSDGNAIKIAYGGSIKNNYLIQFDTFSKNTYSLEDNINGRKNKNEINRFLNHQDAKIKFIMYNQDRHNADFLFSKVNVGAERRPKKRINDEAINSFTKDFKAFVNHEMNNIDEEDYRKNCKDKRDKLIQFLNKYRVERGIKKDFSILTTTIWLVYNIKMVILDKSETSLMSLTKNLREENNQVWRFIRDGFKKYLVFEEDIHSLKRNSHEEINELMALIHDLDSSKKSKVSFGEIFKETTFNKDRLQIKRSFERIIYSPELRKRLSAHYNTKSGLKDHDIIKDRAVEILEDIFPLLYSNKNKVKKFDKRISNFLMQIHNIGSYNNNEKSFAESFPEMVFNKDKHVLMKTFNAILNNENNIVTMYEFFNIDEGMKKDGDTAAKILKKKFPYLDEKNIIE